MKPYGFVAAASMTSQTSMPMRSHSLAISLASAMFTARKMFSSSFASSGVETRTIVSRSSSYSAAARSRHPAVNPPPTFGVVRSV